MTPGLKKRKPEVLGGRIEIGRQISNGDFVGAFDSGSAACLLITLLQFDKMLVSRFNLLVDVVYEHRNCIGQGPISTVEMCLRTLNSGQNYSKKYEIT